MCRYDLPRTGADGRPLRLSALLVAVAVAMGASSGCVQEMADQPRYEPMEASTAAGGASTRVPVPGTIARGQLQLDTVFFSGRADGQFVSELPPQILEGRSLREVLARGRERFGAYCSHCHGNVGGGIGGDERFAEMVGMVVLRGFPPPPTLHQERLRTAQLGYLFDVITAGFGRMPAHGYMISPSDRWAIVAYIRALQLSQHAVADQLPDPVRQQLNTATAVVGAPD